jgi:hypothetical protein
MHPKKRERKSTYSVPPDNGRRKEIEMKRRNLWMSLSLIPAMVIGTAGIAAASGDNDDTHRRHTMQGRQFVWQAQSEKPYALTGEERKQQARDDREQDRAAFQHRGRSGSDFR